METDMMFLFMVAGALFAGVAGAVGYKARYASHMFKIRHDARFILLIVFEVIAFLISAMFIGGDVPGLLIVFIVVFDAFYIVGYRLAHPNDVVFLDIYYKTFNRNQNGPIAMFYKDREMCTMLQTRQASFRSLFGAWDTLQLDLSGVVHTRESDNWSGKKFRRYELIACIGKEPVDLPSVGAVKIGHYKVEGANGATIRVPKYLFSFPRQHHEIVPCASSLQDPRIFEIETSLFESAVLEAQIQAQRAVRLEVQLVAAKYEAAAELVRGMINMTLDTYGARERTLMYVNALIQMRKQAILQEDNANGGNA